MNILASIFKLIQAVEIPWIFKNIQAHKSWKFLEIPSSIFLQAGKIVDVKLLSQEICVGCWAMSEVVVSDVEV